MALVTRSRLDRLVGQIRDRHPGVVLHLRDFLAVGADGTTPPSALIGFARVPGCRPGLRLVVTAGTRPVDERTTDWMVHVAAFRPGDGTQRRTPGPQARAWACAVVGDLWAPWLRQVADDQEWPWPEQLRYPSEKFVVRHHAGLAPQRP